MGSSRCCADIHAPEQAIAAHAAIRAMRIFMIFTSAKIIEKSNARASNRAGQHPVIGTSCRTSGELLPGSRRRAMIRRCGSGRTRR
jgi:hypothetical protein